MARPTVLKPLGQYSILVFQNKGAEALARFLQEHYFNAWSTDEDNILTDIATGDIDIIILDYYNKYGKERDLSLIKTARRYWPNVPIILCVEDDDPAAAVAAYDAGAYDIIHKPYNMEELICKIRVWSKFIPLKYVNIKDECKIHNFVLNAKDQVLFDGTKSITLTDKEMAVASYLFSCPNQLVVTPIILNAIWHQVDVFAKRSLDVYIATLRKYLAPDPTVKIITVFNKGYVLRVENPQVNQ